MILPGDHNVLIVGCVTRGLDLYLVLGHREVSYRADFRLPLTATCQSWLQRAISYEPLRLTATVGG